MQTVLLAAGEGTRMRPLTASRPKPMLPVAGKPLLEHSLAMAATAGATRFIIVIGYYGESIREYFGPSYRDIPIEYVEQTDQTGTADAVQAARPKLNTAPFMVLNGDDLYESEGLRRLYGLDAGVGGYDVSNPEAYGVLELEGDRVTGVIEKPSDPPSTIINTGAIVFPPETIENLEVAASARGEYELTDVLSRVCQDHHVGYVEFDRWLGVGRPWELLEANEWKLQEVEPEQRGTIHDDATLAGRVRVESGATIKAGVTIEGPVVIREGATIGPNAYLRGATLVGKDVTVGANVEIKNSVLMRGTNVPHLSYVGDSVVGRDVNFGAGTVVANLRHDDEPVKLTVKGERVSTGRRKFGVVVGDGAKTGIDTNINAGVTLSTGARTNPGATVTRDQ